MSADQWLILLAGLVGGFVAGVTLVIGWQQGDAVIKDAFDQ